MLSFTFLGKFNAENMYGLASQFWAYKSFWRVRLDKVWWSKLNIFLQQKCSWNVTDVLKHRSTDHWLRWVLLICVLESWYLLPTQLKAFWWNCSLFLEVSEAKGAKISAPWWGEQTHFFVVSIKWANSLETPSWPCFIFECL